MPPSDGSSGTTSVFLSGSTDVIVTSWGGAGAQGSAPRRAAGPALLELELRDYGTRLLRRLPERHAPGTAEHQRLVDQEVLCVPERDENAVSAVVGEYRAAAADFYPAVASRHVISRIVDDERVLPAASERQGLAAGLQDPDVSLAAQREPAEPCGVISGWAGYYRAFLGFLAPVQLEELEGFRLALERFAAPLPEQLREIAVYYYVDVIRNEYGGTALESCQWGSLNFRDPNGDYPGCAVALLRSGATLAYPDFGSDAVQTVLHRHASPS
jgi:hypothetical protein